MVNFITHHKKDIVYLAIIVILLWAGVYFYLHHKTSTEEQPKVMKYEDTTDQDKIKKDLAVDATTAGQIVKKIQYIHDGTTPPTVTYYVQSPTVEKAAEQTADGINKNDTSLPAAATEKTDRTVVTANTDQQKVDVYKINLRNNHKIKAGVLYADDKAYAGVGYQAGRVETMVYMSADGKKAGAVNYTVKEW